MKEPPTYRSGIAKPWSVGPSSNGRRKVRFSTKPSIKFPKDIDPYLPRPQHPKNRLSRIQQLAELNEDFDSDRLKDYDEKTHL
jgi:hypothetical protein